MRTGLYFGTFDPIHIGHLIIGEYMVEFTDLEEVWFVVSPHNPLRSDEDLLDDEHRLEMVRLAISEASSLKLCRDEFDLPRPSYTYNTLKHLSDTYPDRDWTLIMGEDNLRSFDKWWKGEELLDLYRIFVYPRHFTVKEKEKEGGRPISPFADHPSVRVFEAPVLELSATFIREAIRDGRDVRYMLTRPVYEYVRKGGFYQGRGRSA